MEEELKAHVTAGLTRIRHRLKALSGSAAASGAMPADHVKTEADALHEIAGDLHGAIVEAAPAGPGAGVDEELAATKAQLAQALEANSALQAQIDALRHPPPPAAEA